MLTKKGYTNRRFFGFFGSIRFTSRNYFLPAKAFKPKQKGCKFWKRAKNRVDKPGATF
jgi:hypothetical protein